MQSRPPQLLSRRTLVSGCRGRCAALAGCSESPPPTYGNVLRIGDQLTYRARD